MTPPMMRPTTLRRAGAVCGHVALVSAADGFLLPSGTNDCTPTSSSESSIGAELLGSVRSEVKLKTPGHWYEVARAACIELLPG